MAITQSFDRDLLIKATEPLRDINPIETLDYWWTLPHNVMLVDGENVGLATFEYPGFYTCHLYFTERGKKAIELGRAMLNYLFDNYDVKAVRGLIKVENKKARWASRQMGWESLGIAHFPNGDDELFFGTKEHFIKDKGMTNG